MGEKTGALALALLCAACTGTDDEEAFTREDLAYLRTMALDPKVAPPIDVSNDFLRGGRAMTNATDLAVFGQQLFFDIGLSADGTQVACSDCHSPEHWFADARGKQTSFGLDWTDRNSPSLVNVGYYVSFGWDGRADSLWAQGRHAFASAKTMKGTKEKLAEQMAQRYGDRFAAIFGTPLPAQLLVDGGGKTLSEGQLDPIYQAALKAWSAYELRLVSGNSAFDRFALGDASALDSAQRRGLHLFLGKAGCITCHLGPHFTDNRFHNLGLEQKGVNVPGEDLGRFAGLIKLRELPVSYRVTANPPAPTEDDKGRFRTKSLRNVAQTPPYFHAGQAASLADVVWFYSQGGAHGGAGTPSPLIVPLDLTDSERADLVAFLGSLTGDPVAPEWSCNNARPIPDARLIPDAGRGFSTRCAP